MNKSMKPCHKQDGKVTASAFKKGSFGEYLWNHPEEVEAFLEKIGVDLEVLDRIIEQGGGVVPFKNAKNYSRQSSS
jgi:hypothetical protein